MPSTHSNGAKIKTSGKPVIGLIKGTKFLRNTITNDASHTDMCQPITMQLHCDC